MSREDFENLISSVARIELLINIIMKAQYGEKEANRVYNEVVKLVDEKLLAKDNENE